MVGKLSTGEIVGGTFVDLRQHGGVPLVPIRRYPVKNVLTALLQVGTLHRVLDNIEEKCVVEDLQILVVAVSRRALCIRLIAPEELALDRSCVSGEHRQQVDAIGRERRIG